jgi:hypothetical protein
MRNSRWLAACGVMISGMMAMAQQPLPTQNPNPYGYPGYPVAPYGPPLPTAPYSSPVPIPMPPYATPPNLPPLPSAPYALPPGGPYGYPMPMRPNGAAPGMQGMPMMSGGMPYGPMPNGGAGPLPYPGPNSMPYGGPNPMPYAGPNPQPYTGPNPQPYTGPNPMPYGGPMPGPTFAPPDPRLVPGLKPSPLPGYNGPGQPKDATEPYFVLPDSVPPTRTPLMRDGQPTTPGSVITEPFACLVQFVTDPLATEPYTTYEGRTYMAETRLETGRAWAQANFIHWWVRRDSTPPLVTSTTGDPTMTAGLGALGLPDTVVLLGGGAIGPKEFSGIQASLGMWLDPERMESLEIGGFWVGRVTRQYRFASDANGNPLLAQPVLAPTEMAIGISFPGVTSGSIAVSNSLDFYGLELNLAHNLIRLNGWSVDSIVGFRYLYLNDRLDIDQSITVLPGGAGAVLFNGLPLPAGNNVLLNDSFNITNRFYGAQIGARINWASCYGLDLGAVVKVGLGATTHVAVIDGTTTLNAVNGGTASVAGGSLAQPSNIGRFTSTDFSVVPEVTLTLGYQITPALRLLVGYTAIEWTRIQRAGDQIDRRIDTTQVPTFGAAPGTVGTAPTFPAQRTEFWAQGINVGLELKY